MANNATYVLKANGRIEPGWLQGCLTLFKERGISIRKLLLLKNGCPDNFSMLEIHFLLPQPEEPSEAAAHPFLISLQSCLQQQAPTTEQTLTLL